MTTRLLGFVKNAIIAALFGATGEADVLNAVFNIPNTLRKLMAEGALSSAFIPVLSELVVREDRQGGRPRRGAPLPRGRDFPARDARPAAGPGRPLFPRQAVGLFTEFESAEQLELAAGLFRWIAWYLILVSLSAILMGALNTHNRFVLPALTPAVLLLLRDRRAADAAPVARHLQPRGRRALGRRSCSSSPRSRSRPASATACCPRGAGCRPSCAACCELWVPFVATSSIYAVNQLVALRFASGLAEGSASAMSYAVVFWQLPFGVLSASVTTVLFPRMSRQAADGDTDALRESTSYGMRLLGALLVPAAVFFLLEGRSMIEVAYQRGAFTSAATGPHRARAHRLLRRARERRAVHVPAAPVLRAARLPAPRSGPPRSWSWPSTSGLSIWLKGTALGVVGLAVANSSAFTVGLVLLVASARARLGRRIDGRRLALEAARVAAGMLPADARAAGLPRADRLRARPRRPCGARLGLVLAGFALFAGVTLLVYRGLRVQAARDLLGAEARMSARPRRPARLAARGRARRLRAGSGRPRREGARSLRRASGATRLSYGIDDEIIAVLDAMQSGARDRARARDGAARRALALRPGARQGARLPRRARGAGGRAGRRWRLSRRPGGGRRPDRRDRCATSRRSARAGSPAAARRLTDSDDLAVAGTAVRALKTDPGAGELLLAQAPGRPHARRAQAGHDPRRSGRCATRPPLTSWPPSSRPLPGQDVAHVRGRQPGAARRPAGGARCCGRCSPRTTRCCALMPRRPSVASTSPA